MLTPIPQSQRNTPPISSTNLPSYRTMKYLALLGLVSFIPAILANEGDPAVGAWEVDTRVTRDLEYDKRACDYSTKCSCEGVPNGLFCGDDRLHCRKGHVYQCGDDGKKSCHYGIRKSCQNCNKLTC